MDDNAAWRIRVDFASLSDERSFLAWWKDSPLRARYADTPSGDGPTTYFYFPNETRAEAFASDIRQALSTLPTEPAQVAVDHWIPDEGRWSDAPPLRSRASGWLSDVLDSL